MASLDSGDTAQARLIFSDGRVAHYGATDAGQRMAYATWLGYSRGVRVAFRGRGDTSPVYSWDCVDKL